MKCPNWGWHLHIRRERMLGAVCRVRLTHPGLAGFPTSLTLYPDEDERCPRGRGVSMSLEYTCGPRRAVPGGGSQDRDHPGPVQKGQRVSDNSPRQSLSKSGKSLKQKRATSMTKPHFAAEEAQNR